ncbi:MAG: hypothetical protein M1813_001179 [Trichoglossum hirsutum]|nr:MAG: hypothetical protein M1813_001179 [Trichoglossum hirsutum]
MLKWQAQTAICRGRPLCAEFADGIAASLRQFHVSTTLAESEGAKRKGPRISNMSSVYSEIQSLGAQASSVPVRPITGIDARSLGEMLNPMHTSGPTSPLVRPPSRLSGGFHGSGGRKGSGGFHGSGRRDGNNTSSGTQGGFRGRGRGRGGNRRGRGGGRRRIEFASGKGGEQMIEYTPEEIDYLAAKEAAESPKPVPFAPQDVTLTSLTPYAPQIPVSQLGASSIIDSQLRHLASRPLDTHSRIETLTSQLLLGSPVFFESDAERAEVLRAAAAQLKQKNGTVGLGGMEEGKREMEEKLLRGHYAGLEDVGGKVGVLKDVGRLAGKNESYLERDVAKIVERVRKLVPSRLTSPPSGGGAARRRA